MHTNTFRLGLTAAAAALTLAACGSEEPQHNPSDVTFAQQMIPHHQQAIAMADTELAKGSTPRIRTLATAIKNAQGPEIDRMHGWMDTWHAAQPAAGNGMSGGMSHGAMPDGMMSDADMSRFDHAAGRDLDRMFLQLMITHHRGALTMSATEIRDGSDPQAVALARSITTSQQDQIRQMEQLLATT